MEFLVKVVVSERPCGKTIVEESPVKSKGSNAVVEGVIQDIEGGIRAIFLSLQGRLGKKLSAKERIVLFIPAYFAYLYNRLHEGDDGMVPYQRLKGNRPTVLGIEFD